MTDEKMAERILEEAERNVVEMQKIMDEVLEYVPKKDRVLAEHSLNRLEKRIFFQSYLYDCHGALAGYEGDPEKDIVLDYKTYVQAVTIAAMLA